MTAAAAFRNYLDAAHTALNAGEAADCERLAKAICGLVRAERDVAEYLTALQTTDERNDEEALRAELLRRLAHFARAAASGATGEDLAAIAGRGLEA